MVYERPKKPSYASVVPLSVRSGRRDAALHVGVVVVIAVLCFQK